MTDPRSSHFGLRNEAPNLTNDALLPLHASTKLHRSLGVTGGSISRNYVNTNSNSHKTNTQIWIFLPETPRFVQKTNPNYRVMMAVDAGSTPPNSRYVVSSYCVNTNSEITFFDSIRNHVLQKGRLHPHWLLYIIIRHSPIIFPVFSSKYQYNLGVRSC